MNAIRRSEYAFGKRMGQSYAEMGIGINSKALEQKNGLLLVQSIGVLSDIIVIQIFLEQQKQAGTHLRQLAQIGFLLDTEVGHTIKGSKGA